MRRWPTALAVLLIAVYAALLRLDAYTSKYGPVESPAWARVLTTHGAAAGEALEPYDHGWPAAPEPHYVGGDPINYLRFAREMTSFYQAHVREPMYLALTRTYLWLLDDDDAAVSFASATGSILLVVATFFLASAFVPRIAAAAAALAVAVDYEVLTWSVDGWRDDLFAATVVGTAWAALNVRDQPTSRRALALGLVAAASCLTRITALTFIIPGVVWMVLDGPRAARSARLRAGSIALLTAGLLVAPYLINCAIATGDPLFAINYHTVYYRYESGLPAEGHVSAASYLGSRLASRPFQTLDTGMMGLFVHPFASKWSGLDPLLGRGRWILFWAAAMGLLALARDARGRLLLVVLLASLLPYAFTWNIGDGGAFRFTMHAYPFYIVSGIYVIASVLPVVASAARTRQLPRPSRRAAWFGAAGLAVAAVAVCAYHLLPWLVLREAIAAREDVNIETGGRDWIFFRDGWSPPHNESITVRVSHGNRSVVWLPLPSKRDYDIVLRVDPVAPEAGQQLSVLFNGHFVSRVRLGFDPQRVGSYRFRVREQQVGRGLNQLVLAPEPAVPAAETGPRFAWLPPDTRIGVRLWYVRVIASE
jgi:hypothetical protein